MTGRSEGTKNVSITAGIVCGGAVTTKTIESNVSGDSESTTLGIAAKTVSTDSTKSVIEHRGEPLPSQRDSGPAERPGPSRQISSSGGPARNQTDSGQAERPGSSKTNLKRRSSKGNEGISEVVFKLPRGLTASTLTTESLTIGKDLDGDVTNSGDGIVISHISPIITVHGFAKDNLHYQDTKSKESTSDDSFFHKRSSSKADCYKLERPSAALIINNVFDNDPDAEYKKKYREGAEEDTKKMAKLFGVALKFGFVQKQENVSSKDLKGILEKFRGVVKKQNYSSCFIIIMSHGGKAVNSILMDDMKDVDLYSQIVYEFSDHEDVREIPKVFLVQACRDSKDPPTSHTGSEKRRDIQHVLIGHSTGPYTPAKLCNMTGSLYFSAIYDVFRMKAQNSSLQSMLREVSEDERLREWNQSAPFESYGGFQDYIFNLSFESFNN